jgi:hypothetical protein
MTQLLKHPDYTNNRFSEHNIPRKRMSFRGGRSWNAQPA